MTAIEQLEQRYRLGTIWFTIWLTFISLLALLVFQFVLHTSQTKDLQRRVGTLERQVQELRR